MMTFVLLLAGLAILDLAAFLWGADSREKMDSPEWARRQNWRGFH